MKNEPFIIAMEVFQDNPNAALPWLEGQVAKAREQGATWWRVTTEAPGLALFEAWKERPLDEGEPRWQR